MKTTLESIVSQTFVGKRFVSSEFHEDPDEEMHDMYGQVIIKDDGELLLMKDLIGKVIKKAGVTTIEDNAGLALSFEGVSQSLFFFNNCNITVEDVVEIPKRKTYEVTGMCRDFGSKDSYRRTKIVKSTSFDNAQFEYMNWVTSDFDLDVEEVYIESCREVD